MKLLFEQIQDITFGALETVVEDDGIEFYRMTNKMSEKINSFNSDFGIKTLATAGIRFDFYTDSEFFSFEYDRVKKTSSRNWYYFSLLVNGESVALIGEDTPEKFCGSYKTTLPKGKNRITLFFPNLYRARIRSVELSDGAYFEPFKAEKRFVFHGDSITHGYDAKSAANSYVNRIALATNAEIFNFAIGGAFFDSRMIDGTDDYDADAVFVAYGTNDWSHSENKQVFSKSCDDFMKKLTEVFDNIPIYIILPIWRVNCQDIKPMGTFQEAKDTIKQIVSAYGNTKIIDLANDIPHDVAFFSDGLHPNDKGFACYSQGVLRELGE